jgi:hypothetical protein
MTISLYLTSKINLSDKEWSLTEHSINHFQVDQGKFPISALLQRIGDDYLLSIWGGAAHIGAVAMAQPRPSLADANRMSSTASVFCYVGHKEDELVRRISERLSAALSAKVVVVAGLHWDNLLHEEIAQVLSNADLLVSMILDREAK